MKKILMVISTLCLLINLLVLISFAAVETISWGSQSFWDEKFAEITGPSGTHTVVDHTFDNVGFTYIYADCINQNATFVVKIQKGHLFGLYYTTEATANCNQFRQNIEWGFGGNYGSGKYKFKLIPINNNSSQITIQDFYSKADP